MPHNDAWKDCTRDSFRAVKRERASDSSCLKVCVKGRMWSQRHPGCYSHTSMRNAHQSRNLRRKCPPNTTPKLRMQKDRGAFQRMKGHGKSRALRRENAE